MFFYRLKVERQNKMEEANEYFLEAVSGVDDTPELQVHPYTWRYVTSYADFLNKWGRVDEAVRRCQRSLQAQRRALGEDHPHTKESQQVMRWITRARDK